MRLLSWSIAAALLLALLFAAASVRAQTNALVPPTTRRGIITHARNGFYRLRARYYWVDMNFSWAASGGAVHEYNCRCGVFWNSSYDSFAGTTVAPWTGHECSFGPATPNTTALPASLATWAATPLEKLYAHIFAATPVNSQVSQPAGAAAVAAGWPFRFDGTGNMSSVPTSAIPLSADGLSLRLSNFVIHELFSWRQTLTARVDAAEARFLQRRGGAAYRYDVEVHFHRLSAAENDLYLRVAVTADDAVAVTNVRTGIRVADDNLDDPQELLLILGGLKNHFDRLRTVIAVTNLSHFNMSFYEEDGAIAHYRFLRNIDGGGAVGSVTLLFRSFEFGDEDGVFALDGGVIAAIVLGIAVVLGVSLYCGYRGLVSADARKAKKEFRAVQTEQRQQQQRRGRDDIPDLDLDKNNTSMFEETQKQPQRRGENDDGDDDEEMWSRGRGPAAAQLPPVERVDTMRPTAASAAPSGSKYEVSRCDIVDDTLEPLEE